MPGRWRSADPVFVVSVIVFVACAAGLAILHSYDDACTVGFRTSGEVLGPGQVAHCLNYQLLSAILVVAAIVAGGVIAWFGARFLRTGSIDRRKTEPAGSGRSDSRLSQGILSRVRAWSPSNWLALMVGVFFVVTFFAASWQYVSLVRFDTDLALNQQVLSSTLQGGKPYQFYESFNCINHGQCSYLLVHQVFAGYLLVPVYGVAPGPFTLLAIQSLVFGVAAVPLYLLAVEVIGSRRLSLAIAGTYLAWIPLQILATRDTFNWEAFIPLEIITVFWLWNRQQYALAIPVVLVTYLTYEVNTVLVFFVGLFFVWPWLVRAVRLLARSFVPATSPSAPFASRLRLWGRWIWRVVRVPQVYASLILMAGSTVAYVLLRLFVLHGGWLLGLPPVPANYALPVGTPNKVFSFTFAYLSFAWQAKLWFWIVIYLTLGFIPLLAPRAILLVVPWILLSVFNVTSTFWTFNGHYAVPAAPALLIGFVFGISWLYRRLSTRISHAADRPSKSKERSEEVSATITVPGGTPTQPRARRPRPVPGAVRAGGVVGIAIVIVIAGNLLLNPLNPIAATIVPELGPPFPPTYGVDYSTGPSNVPLQQMASIIPRNAVVAAPVSVFPLVANDPYAFPLQGSNSDELSRLPADEWGRLGYVLLPSDTPSNLLGPSMLSILYDRYDFGVRACVSNSTQGAVELFERDYSGDPELIGASGPLCPNYFSGGAGLTASEDSAILSNASSPSGVVVQSRPCAARGSFPVWGGPGIQLPSGQYLVSVAFNALNVTDASCAKQDLNSTRSVMTMNITGLIGTPPSLEVFEQHRLAVNQACTTECGWDYWNSTLTVPSSASDVLVSGSEFTAQFVVQVAYVVFSPDPS